MTTSTIKTMTAANPHGETMLDHLNYRAVHIGSMHRSGAALLNRLFDGHADCAVYPSEMAMPRNYNLYPMYEVEPGTPNWIPHFEPSKDFDILSFFDISEVQTEQTVKYGREVTDPMGVRKNYLEKAYYQHIPTNFDYPLFVKLLKNPPRAFRTLHEVFAWRHHAYFEAWDNGAHRSTMDVVVTNDSNDFFLYNIDRFMDEFPGSVFIFPLRLATGYLASQKTRLAQRFYWARRFSRMKLPNYFVRHFKGYDLNALIRSWLVAVTRAVVLQERFGVNDRFVVYRYENLKQKTEEVMRVLAGKMGIDWHETLLEPTLIGEPWLGNSHQGKRFGVDPNKMNEYYTEVFSKSEIERIFERCGPLMEAIERIGDTPADFTKIPRELLYDYEFQSRYFDDKEKMSLYLAFCLSGSHKVRCGRADWWSIPALFYGELVRLAHQPRLVRMRLFPGVGRQQYR